MPIKAIICDLDGTLITGIGLLQDGAEEMLTRVRELGLKLYVASNRAPRPGIDRYLKIPSANILLRSTVGASKGSGRFVETVCTREGIARNEILYLGDGDMDRNETVNTQVIMFLAGWSAPDYPYGIPVSTPQEFASIVETFFLKDTLWYYKVDDTDAAGRPVSVRALLHIDEAKKTGIVQLLKTKGLSAGGIISGFPLKRYMSLHLLASIYLEGLHQNDTRTLWAMYPSHDGSQGGVLNEFATMATRLFRDQYRPDLIIRHKVAQKSAYARSRGERLTIGNQMQTIHLNSALREKIEGRRVLVIDDNTTQAHAFESSRNYLLNAGAKEVIAIAVGKYPTNSRYQALDPKTGVGWDSYLAANLDESDFNSRYLQETRDINATIVDP